MVSGQHRCAIGTLANGLDAKQVFNELKRAGVPIPHISIVPIDSKDIAYKEELGEAEISDSIEDDPQEEMGAMAATIVGSLLGAIGGCLAGLGLLLIPEVGFFVVVGTWGTPLLTTVAGAGIGAASGGLLNAVAGMDTSENRVEVNFEHDSKAEYLVMVEGTDEEVNQAESILDRLNQKYLKINLPSFSGHPLVELFKIPGFWKSW